jgi:hypothetical protein
VAQTSAHHVHVVQISAVFRIHRGLLIRFSREEHVVGQLHLFRQRVEVWSGPGVVEAQEVLVWALCKPTIGRGRPTLFQLTNLRWGFQDCIMTL